MNNVTADLNTLSADARRLILYCAETIVEYRAYTPGQMLVMLVGRFRDDVCAALGEDPRPRAYRGSEHCSLSELKPIEMDTLSGAVGILLDQFTGYLDDPELPNLLGEFRAAMDAEQAVRQGGGALAANAKAT